MRLVQLDIFRGIACLMVLAFHYTSRYSAVFNTNITTQIFDLKYGGLGVDLFFIISGFVIFMSINKNTLPGEFLIRRFKRLYPTFWICVFMTFFIIHVSDLNQYKRQAIDLIVNLSMVPSVFGYAKVDGVYWSLLPELLFYFFCFVLMFFNKLKSINFISITWLSLIVINHFNELSYFRVLLNLTFGHLFIIGIYFYRIMFDVHDLKNHYILLLSMLIAFLLNEDIIRDIHLMFFIVLFYLLVYHKLSWVKSKLLIKLGEISYALYLLHQYVGFAIIHHLVNIEISNPLLLFVIPSLISILLSASVTYYIEPFLRKYIEKILSFNRK